LRLVRLRAGRTRVRHRRDARHPFHDEPPLPPANESAFHITEFASNARHRIFPLSENLFCIAKTIGYLIEK
jgi:hypothetical protein